MNALLYEGGEPNRSGGVLGAFQFNLPILTFIAVSVPALIDDLLSALLPNVPLHAPFSVNL
jgi:hypothetical protein